MLVLEVVADPEPEPEPDGCVLVLSMLVVRSRD